MVEAGERSKQIQALLKLEEVGKIRSVLATARNRVTTAHGSAQKNSSNTADALRRHLDIKELSAEDILAVVNTQRRVLGLSAIGKLTAEATLNTGAPEGAPHAVFNKTSATRDINALKKESGKFPTLGAQESAAILADIAALENDPALLDALTRRSFLETGLALVDGPSCPLCDQEWDDESHLKEHLVAKLAKSAQAEAVEKRLRQNAEVISSHAMRVIALLSPIRTLAASDGPPGLADDLAVWAERLSKFARTLSTVAGVLGHKARFQRDWIAAPDSLSDGVETLSQAVLAKPDQSATATAISFLTLAQDRLHSYRTGASGRKAGPGCRGCRQGDLYNLLQRRRATLERPLFDR